MTFGQKLVVIWCLASALGGIVAVPAFGRNAQAAPRRVGAVAMCVGIVASALIVVGFVSHTLSLHFIQIGPLVLALALLRFRSRAGVLAAAPLFAFWILVMGGIWLFLLGVARIFSQRQGAWSQKGHNRAGRRFRAAVKY